MKKLNFILFLLIPLFSFAQSNYKAGYIVNIKGDTIKGYIDYKEWGHNPKTISFKSRVTDKAAALGLEDINGFEVSGYVSFEKHQVTISQNIVDINSPSALSDTGKITDKVFLKVLQKGNNVVLYVFKDNIKERYYVKEANMQQPFELLFGVYQAPTGDGVVYKNTYQDQLSQLVTKYKGGADKLLRLVKGISYREPDLIQVAAQINGNSGAQAAVKSSGSATVAARFYGGAAFISSTLKDGAYYGSPSSTSGVPKIALGVDVIPNPGVGHLIFRLEAAYATNNFIFNDQSDPLYNIANAPTSVIKVKQRVLYITPQVIYNIYNAETLKVFIDLGYTFDLVSYPSVVTTTTQGSNVSSTTTKNFAEGRDNYSSFQFKVGVVLNKRLEIYGAMFPGTEIANSLTYSTNLSSFQLGLNYFFGSKAR